jgi:hypothetical protein
MAVCAAAAHGTPSTRTSTSVELGRQQVAHSRKVARCGAVAAVGGHRHGTGADVESTVRALVGALVACLVEHPSTAVTKVYLLAYTDAELTAPESPRRERPAFRVDAYRPSGRGLRPGRLAGAARLVRLWVFGVAVSGQPCFEVGDPCL